MLPLLLLPYAALPLRCHIDAADFATFRFSIFASLMPFGLLPPLIVFAERIFRYAGFAKMICHYAICYAITTLHQITLLYFTPWLITLR